MPRGVLEKLFSAAMGRSFSWDAKRSPNIRCGATIAGRSFCGAKPHSTLQRAWRQIRHLLRTTAGGADLVDSFQAEVKNLRMARQIEDARILRELTHLMHEGYVVKARMAAASFGCLAFLANGRFHLRG